MNVLVRGIVLGMILLSSSVLPTIAEESPTSQHIVASSIAYHDPNGVWDRGRIQLDVRTTYSAEFAERVGRKEAAVRLWLSPGEESFRYQKEVGEDVIDYKLNGELGSVAVNGSADISEEDRERLRVGEPSDYRDYFEYLYGMPMKLRDPGTNMDPMVQAAEFNGRDSWALRVTYDPAVGEDIWYFYFDKTTFALIGYKFFHDESKNDGEYITFEGEIHSEATGMRLPKVRAWYYNADDKHLATDDIVSLNPQATGHQ